MPDRTVSEVHATLATFRSLLENHAHAEARLLERRAIAAPEAWPRLDRLLAMTRQTADTLRRTIQTLEQQVQEIPASASEETRGAARAPELASARNGSSR